MGNKGQEQTKENVMDVQEENAKIQDVKEVKGRRVFITLSIDILFTLILFYNFSQWGQYETLSARILGIFACIIVLNDWMTVRETYDVYGARVFITDVVVAFCYANLPNALNASDEVWGYSSEFWLYIAIVEFSYIFWDLFIRQLAPGTERKKRLTLWAVLSIVSTSLATVTFVLQHFQIVPISIGHLSGWVTSLYILGMNIGWNWERYRASSERSEPFIK